MPDRIRVCVQAADPVCQAGVVSQLRFRPELDVSPCPDRAPDADVIVAVVDVVDDDVLRMVKEVRRDSGARFVVISATLDGPAVLAAVEAGASGLLRRREATADRVAEAITAVAAGDGALPPDLLGRLLQQVGRPLSGGTPHGFTFGGLTQRELEVLRLIAEGYSTTEIARRLAYSERTIKNAIQDVTRRLHLRNRSHAVAFAVRAGLI